jgi:hypothetical protein
MGSVAADGTGRRYPVAIFFFITTRKRISNLCSEFYDSGDEVLVLGIVARLCASFLSNLDLLGTLPLYVFPVDPGWRVSRQILPK